MIKTPMDKLDLLKNQTLFCESLKNAGKSFNTVKNYKTDLNIFNQFLISRKRKLKINEVTTSELKDYQKFLDQKYNSPNSIRRRVQALRIFFDYLIENNVFDHNPVKKMVITSKVVDIPRPPKFHTVQTVVTNLNAQISQAYGHEKLLAMRNLLIVKMIYSGCFKVSDLEKLKAAHVKEYKGTLRVLIAHPKKEPYTVPLTKDLTELINEYSSLLQIRKEKDGVDFDDFLFNANPFKILKGGLSSRGIEVIFKEISKKLDTQMTAKSLRQACVFRWLIEKKEDSRIKEWMSVQPSYSLTPYKKLLEDDPARYCYMELQV